MVTESYVLLFSKQAKHSPTLRCQIVNPPLHGSYELVHSSLRIINNKMMKHVHTIPDNNIRWENQHEVF